MLPVSLAHDHDLFSGHAHGVSEDVRDADGEPFAIMAGHMELVEARRAAEDPVLILTTVQCNNISMEQLEQQRKQRKAKSQQLNTQS